ncbi:MAG: cyclic nucleotide-binding domain-containing protein [Gammaproteobacteria bacterium]|nr:cyclic nucleotide-binding domain-containing protein [Gammaproteobacteria bacterium]
MHWLQRKVVRDWLNLEPGEFKPASLCFAISFTWGFSQMLSWTAANTLFLQYYNATELPIISVASAALIPLTGLVFLRLNRLLPFTTQFRIFAALFILVPLAFRLLLGVEGLRWPSLAYAVWYYLEVAFAALLTDAFVNRMFNLRQARRVFGPISTGSDLAGIPSGLLVGVVVGHTGVENLLLFSASVSALVLVLFRYTARVFSTRLRAADASGADDPDEYTGPAVSVKALLRNPLVLCILGIEALSEFNLEFLNNAFYAQTELYLAQPEQMAAFLGKFFAIASVVSSCVQMLASSRLMRALGVDGCLMLGPSMLTLMLLAFVAGNWLGFPAGFVFGCMAGAKFVQYTIMINVNDVAQFTLVRSLSPAMQDRVLALSGTVLAPVLGGVSGLSLLGMIHLLGIRSVGIASVSVFILAVIILIGRRTAHAYRENLRQTLNDRAITGIELPLTDPGTAEVLRSLLRSPDAHTALCSLDLMARKPVAEMRPALIDALQHTAPRVRRQAARLLQEVCDAGDAPSLSRALSLETDPDVLAELLPAYSRSAGADGDETLAAYLDHAQTGVRQGALVGLLRHGGERGLDNAGRRLQRLAESEDAAQRRFAAETLGRIGSSSLDGVLLALLADQEVDVRRAAILAARHVRNPLLGPVVLQNLADPGLRPAVVETLVQGADIMLPAIDDLYGHSGSTVDLKVIILRIFGRIRSAAGLRLLKKRLEETDPDLLREAIIALARGNYRIDDDDGRERVGRLIDAQAACATWLLRCITVIGPHGESELLRRALERELHKRQDLLFLLFGFLYPGDTMRFIRFACLYSRSEDKVASAVELLDTLLQRSPHRAVLPVFEDTSLERRLAALEQSYPIAEPDLSACLRGILNGQCSCRGRWLIAVALRFAERNEALQGGLSPAARDEGLALAKSWTEPAPDTRDGGAGMSVIDKVVALRRASIFADVPDEILSEYAPRAILRTFPAGTSIMRAGERGSTLCVVVSGSVRVTRGAQTLATLATGGVVGELSALSSEVRTADVEAIEEARVLELDTDSVNRMIAERGEAAEGVIRVLCQRIQSSLRERTFEDTGRFSIQATPVPVEDATVRMLEDVEKAVLLKKAEIFSTLSDPILLHLGRLATEQCFSPGETLFRRGDFGTAMFVIAEGGLAVHDEDRLVADLHQGEVVGELGLLTSEVRSASVTARKFTRLLKINQGALFELMWDHPQVSRNLIHVLVTRLRRMMTAQGAADPELTPGH